MSHSSRWDSIPFSPRSSPLFYGWVIVASSCVGILVSVPGQTIGVSVFTDPLLLVLEMNRVELSTAYMLGTVLSSLALPYAGRLYDRLGARIMTPVAALALGIILVVLSRIDIIVGQLWRLIPVARIWISLSTMIVAFALLRFFGQGMMTMLSRNMAMKWFVRRRGIVNGILGVCIAVGFSTLVYLLNQLVLHVGWSAAWCYTGLFIGGGFSLFAALLYRDTPQGSDLLPDGADASTQKVPDIGILHDGATLTIAKGYFEFWIYAITLAFAALSVTAVSFHIVSVFEAAGHSRETAVGVYLPAACVSALFTITFGWLSDRAPLSLLLRGLCLGQICFSLGLLFLHLPIGYWLLVLGFGSSQAMFGLLLGLSWPRLFGVLYLGEISGYAMGLTVFGSAIGPLLFGLSESTTGTYGSAEFGFAFCAIVLFLASLRAQR
jgi:MFS family permease